MPGSYTKATTFPERTWPEEREFSNHSRANSMPGLKTGIELRPTSSLLGKLGIVGYQATVSVRQRSIESRSLWLPLFFRWNRIVSGFHDDQEIGVRSFPKCHELEKADRYECESSQLTDGALVGRRSSINHQPSIINGETTFTISSRFQHETPIS